MNLIAIAYRNAFWGLRQIKCRLLISFCIVITFSFSLGIINILFSVVDSAVLRSIPFHDSQRLVEFVPTARGGAGNLIFAGGMATVPLAQWQRRKDLFVGIEAYVPPKRTVSAKYNIQLGYISPGLPRLTGISPMLGRTFDIESPKTASEAILLSERFWETQFRRDPSVLGQSLVINNKVLSIIGIMPKRFQLPLGSASDAWLALLAPTKGAFALGRLSDAASLDNAKREVSLARIQDVDLPATESWVIDLNPVKGPLPAKTITVLYVLLGGALFLWMISCANICNIHLIHVSQMRSELAVRAALGARTSELVSQVFGYVAILSCCGGIGGFLITWSVQQSLPALVPPTLRLFAVNDLTMNGRVVAFSILMTCATVFCAAIIPAWRVRSMRVLDSLSESRRGTIFSRSTRVTQGVLQSVQVGLGFVLLCGMGLVTNSFLRLTAMERGFDPERLFVVDFGLTMKEYRTRPLREAFIYETIRRIRELPAVEASTPSIGTPLLGIKGNRFVAEANDRSDKTIGALEIFDIQPEYFHIVGIEIKKGRNFDATDSRSSELVGIIDQRSASRSWPGEDPIGKRFRSRSDGPWITVVGVVQSVKTDTYVNDDGYLQAYLPLAQEENWLNVHVVIKRRGQAFLNPEAVREKVKAVNGKIVVERIARLDELYSAMFESALVTPRFYLLLFTSLALAACTIAAIGIYAALSYSTKQREGEMGIRIALGASPAHVRNLVFIEMLACVAYGIGGGFVILSWSSSVIRSILYGLPNNDPVTIFAVLLTILAISGLAAYLPARRASNVDPAITIRNGSA